MSHLRRLKMENDNAIYRDVNFTDMECKSIIDQLIGEKLKKY